MYKILRGLRFWIWDVGFRRKSTEIRHPKSKIESFFIRIIHHQMAKRFDP